jgi:hypothetical protein
VAVVEALVRTLMAQLFPLEHTLRRLGLSWEQCVPDWLTPACLSDNNNRRFSICTDD